MKIFLKKIIVALLQIEARLVLKKYKPKIVAVTGSVGKTSTKDALYTVLSSTFFVRKSEKSFNSEIGIPLTILGQPNGWSNPFIWMANLFEGFLLIVLKNHYPKWLVLEVGADRPGDIKNIAKWLKPDIVVVTRLPTVPVHIEFFDSLQAVVNEKKYLVQALKRNGVLILNSDDEKVFNLKESVLATTTTFGFLKGADLVVQNSSITYTKRVPTGMQFRADYNGSSIPIVIEGAIGRQHIYSILAALTVGLLQHCNTTIMGQALAKHSLAPGRMKLLEGIKDTIIIDDSYNSSPVAAREALSVIKNVTVLGKKIVLLGDMMELGQYSVEEHKKIGKQAAEVCDLLVTVGVRARAFAEGALIAGMSEKNIKQYDDAQRAGKELETVLTPGDIVLIKGSQSVRMERAVLEIMASPERRKELLVRQEKEWEVR